MPITIDLGSDRPYSEIIEVPYDAWLELLRGGTVEVNGRVLTPDDAPFSPIKPAKATVERHGRGHEGQQGVEGQQGGSQEGYTHTGGGGEKPRWAGDKHAQVGGYDLYSGKFGDTKGQWAVDTPRGGPGGFRDTPEEAISDYEKAVGKGEEAAAVREDWKTAIRQIGEGSIDDSTLGKLGIRYGGVSTTSAKDIMGELGIKDRKEQNRILRRAGIVGDSAGGAMYYDAENVFRLIQEHLGITERHGKHEGQEGVEGQQGGSAPGFTHEGGEGNNGRAWPKSLKDRVVDFIYKNSEIVAPGSIGDRFKSATILPDGRVALSGDAHINLRKSIFKEFGEEEFPGDQAEFGVVDSAEFKAQGFIRTDLIMQTHSGTPLVYFEFDPEAITVSARQAMRDIYWAAFKPDIGPPNVAIDWEDSGGTWHSIGMSDLPGRPQATIEEINRELGFKIDRSLVGRHGEHEGQRGVKGQRGGSAKGYSHKGSRRAEKRRGGRATSTFEGFHSAFSKAMEDNKYSAFVTHYTPEELSEMEAVLLTNGGKTGIAIKDHGGDRIEGTALFNAGGPRGAGIELLKQAITEHGVNYLEALGGVLKNKYESIGFEVIETFEFDRDLAPDDWDYDTFGEPSYYTFRYVGKVGK